MIKAPLTTSALLAATLLLSACGDEKPKVVGGNPDTQAAELATAPPVELPPSVTASRTYRCKDGTLVYVDVLSDGSANLKTEPTGTPTRAKPAEGGGTLVADGGWSLSGTDSKADIGVPGKSAQSCKA